MPAARRGAGWPRSAGQDEENKASAAATACALTPRRRKSGGGGLIRFERPRVPSLCAQESLADDKAAPSLFGELSEGLKGRGKQCEQSEGGPFLLFAMAESRRMPEAVIHDQGMESARS